MCSARVCRLKECGSCETVNIAKDILVNMQIHLSNSIAQFGHVSSACVLPNVLHGYCNKHMTHNVLGKMFQTKI